MCSLFNLSLFKVIPLHHSLRWTTQFGYVTILDDDHTLVTFSDNLLRPYYLKYVLPTAVKRTLNYYN